MDGLGCNPALGKLLHNPAALQNRLAASVTAPRCATTAVACWVLQARLQANTSS